MVMNSMFYSASCWGLCYAALSSDGLGSSIYSFTEGWCFEFEPLSFGTERFPLLNNNSEFASVTVRLVSASFCFGDWFLISRLLICFVWYKYSMAYVSSKGGTLLVLFSLIEILSLDLALLMRLLLSSLGRFGFFPPLISFNSFLNSSCNSWRSEPFFL